MARWLICLLLIALPASAVADRAMELDGATAVNLVITVPAYSGCSVFDDADYTSCEDLASAPQSGSAAVWVVVTRVGGFASGIAELAFGIEHSGVSIFDWTLCTGGLETPEQGGGGQWPESGTGNAVVWDGACYDPPGEVAKVGFFSVTDGSWGSMSVTPDPRTQWASYTPCGGSARVICDGNLADLTFSSGGDPICDDQCAVLIEQVSWGAIKSLYSD